MQHLFVPLCMVSKWYACGKVCIRRHSKLRGCVTYDCKCAESPRVPLGLDVCRSTHALHFTLHGDRTCPASKDETLTGYPSGGLRTEDPVYGSIQYIINGTVRGGCLYLKQISLPNIGYTTLHVYIRGVIYIVCISLCAPCPFARG